MPLIRSTLLRPLRCHPFTWCVTFLVGLAVFVIVAPGEYVDVPRRDSTTRWQEQSKANYQNVYDKRLKRLPDGRIAHVTVRAFEHGWPRPYLARFLVYQSSPTGAASREISAPLIQYQSPFRSWGGRRNLGVSWSNYDNWPLSADDWMLDPWSLALDVLVALAIVGVVGAATERWVRRRDGLLRFRLVDMLGAVAVAGVLLGWTMHHVRIQSVERQHAEPPFAPGFYSHQRAITTGQRYTGPDWLRRLVGSEYLLPWLHHVYYVALRPSENWRREFDLLPRLPYLEHVNMSRTAPAEVLATLERCPKLRILALPQLPHVPIPEKVGYSERALSVDDLPRLKQLQLTELELTGDAILARDVEPMVAIRSLRTLSLQNLSATPAEIDALRAKHPQVRIAATWYYDQWFYPTPPPGHDATVAEVKLGRQQNSLPSFRCAMNDK